MEDLVFSTNRQEVPIVIDEKKYILRELTSEDKDKYLTSMGGKMLFNKEGDVTSITDYTDLHANLVALTLFDENGVLVSLDAIHKYPSRMVTALYEKAQEISGLGKEAKEKAKKD